MDLIWLNRGTILLILTGFLCAACWRRGAGPERMISSVLVLELLVDRAYHFLASGGKTVWTLSDYATIDLGHFLIDLSAMVILVSIALRANRIYPLWIGGIQIIALMSHVVMELGPEMHPVAYAGMNRATFYLQVTILFAGLILHWRRTGQIGHYRAWRTN